jgi:serine/threonine protein kinase
MGRAACASQCKEVLRTVLSLIALQIALDVARGLVFLHSRRVVHFDLKSPNILLARDGTAKIGDVGMAKILAGDYVTGVVSTLAW